MTIPVAETEWASFSYQLSAEQRDELENGGAEEGRAEGARFLKIYPKNEAESEDTVQIISSPST